MNLMLKVNEDDVLLCPMCWAESVHPVKLMCKPLPFGEGMLSITAEEVSQIKYNPKHTNGVEICMDIWCEGCHGISRISFHFCKGNTFVTCKEVGSTKGKSPDDIPKTIWRE